MIYPSQRAVTLTLAAAPVALAIGVVRPGGWVVGLFWALGIAVLALIDGLMTRGFGRGAFTAGAPAVVQVGDAIALNPAIEGKPARTEFAVEISAPAEAQPGTRLNFQAARRGTARIARIWARRRGPLGLGYRQTSRKLDESVRILPDLGPVREQGMRQYLRSTLTGQRMRRDSGDGSEFQALVDFQPGMERRVIDWKASARHSALLAREFRPERDNSVVFAIDGGRTMSDPVDGVPRVDRAVSAALLAAFVALKSGDRVRLFSFAARPQADSGSQTGARGFTALHKAASEIDYGREESNFTLSLITLDQRLERRSLIVLFTEFTDQTAAELMLTAAGRLLKRHRVLFVLFNDVEVEAIFARRPESADDVVRANVAAALLRERRIVIERLRRLGVDVIEAAPDAMPLTLVERYLHHRERN